MEMHHNVASVVHFLYDLFKLRNRGHHGIKLLSLVGIGECPIRIHNQNVEKDMRNLIHINRFRLRLLRFVPCNLFRQITAACRIELL